MKKVLIPISILVSSGLSFLLGYLIKKPKNQLVSGTLRIDNSDPELPNALFLELDETVESISKKKSVTFRVLKKNYIRK